MALQWPALPVCADPGATTPPPVLGRQLLLGFDIADDDRVHDPDLQPPDVSPAPAGPIAGFIGRQEVETIDGPMRISRLCEKRLGLHVRTFAEDRGEWVYRPIVGWHVARARVDDMLTVELDNKLCLYATPDQRVLLPDGQSRQFGALAPGEALATWGPIPTGHQWDLMFGSLLGDASSTAVGFTCEHSVNQAGYLAWKQSVLCGLGALTFDRKERKVPSTIGGEPIRSSPSRIVRVAGRHIYEELRKECYGGQDDQKRVTDAWLARVGGLGVTAWVLDDGSITNRGKGGGFSLTGNIATHGFEPEDRERLASWLSGRYGHPCTVNVAGALSLWASLSAALIEEVARWIPWRAIPASKKFLAESVARIQSAEPPRAIDSTSRLGRVPRRVRAIRPYRHDKPDIPEVNVYSLTVEETRTFCAGSILVAGP